MQLADANHNFVISQDATKDNIKFLKGQLVRNFIVLYNGAREKEYQTNSRINACMIGMRVMIQ